jgi:hypothetical protein
MGRVACGLVPEVHVIDKFGYNSAVGTGGEEDIWSVGGEETMLTSGATMYVSCTDNVNGVGQTIRVYGLNENWHQVYGQAVLTGNTQAEIKDMDGGAMTFTRIHRAFQSSAGADPVGDVYIAESDTLTGGVPDTATKIHGKVDYTNAAQQTQKAIFTIPRDHIGLIYEVQGYLATPTTGSARSCTLRIETADLVSGASPDNPSWKPRRAREEYVVGTTGSGQFEHKMFSPIFCGPLTDVHLRGIAFGAACGVYGSFEILILPLPANTILGGIVA